MGMKGRREKGREGQARQKESDERKKRNRGLITAAQRPGRKSRIGEIWRFRYAAAQRPTRPMDPGNSGFLALFALETAWRGTAIRGAQREPEGPEGPKEPQFACDSLQPDLTGPIKRVDRWTCAL